jgi:hypothetical protein
VPVPDTIAGERERERREVARGREQCVAEREVRMRETLSLCIYTEGVM